MSQSRWSLYGASRQNERSEELVDEPPRKQKKLDKHTQRPVKEFSAEGQSTDSKVEINDLPDELMVKILSHEMPEELVQVTQNVSRRWRRLSNDREVWRDKIFRIDSSCSDGKAVAMLRRIPQLRTVVVRRDVESSVIGALCGNCSHLTTVMVDAPTSFPLLKRLAQKCENIQTLSVPHYVLWNERNARAVVELSRLQSLNVQVLNNYRLDRRVHLRPLGDGCPELTTLDLAEGVNVSVEDVEYFFNKKRKTLTHVTLPWVLHNRRCVVPLLKDCTSLSYLQLNYCKVIGDEAPGAFAALGRLSNLRSLIISDLVGCPTGAAKLAFESGGLSCLQVLKITASDLEDDAVVTVCKRCPELKVLQLIQCTKLTDNALNKLCHLRKLEVLNLRHCKGLRGEAITHVAKVTKLRKLFINGLYMKHLKPGLEKILDMAKLETLSFEFSHRVSVFPFERLPENLGNLRPNVIDSIDNTTVNTCASKSQYSTTGRINIIDSPAVNIFGQCLSFCQTNRVLRILTSPCKYVLTFTATSKDVDALAHWQFSLHRNCNELVVLSPFTVQL